MPATAIELRDCPFCAEPIKRAAIKCKHCGSEVESLAESSSQVVTHGWLAEFPVKSPGDSEKLLLAFEEMGLRVVDDGRKNLAVGPFAEKKAAGDVVISISKAHSIYGELKWLAGSTEGGNSQGQPSPPKKGLPVLAWIFIVPAALFAAFLALGFVLQLTDPNSDAKARAAQAIELCWKGVDDELASISARRFTRDVCRKMAEDYEARYGRSSFIRKD